MTQLIVEAQNLQKMYPLGKQHVEALKGIDLELEQGAFAVLLGPSGAGKTTTLNLLGCLDKPTGGKLRVADTVVYDNGRSVSERKMDAMRRKHIGLVFTEFFLLPTLTAIENVELPMLWGGKPNREKAVALLKTVGLGHRLTHRPPELSGGEMQRVAIARALVNDPALLLADEPTGNLDTRTRDEVFAVLRDLNEKRGLTVLVVTHDHELAGRFGQVLHIRDGALVRDGAHVC